MPARTSVVLDAVLDEVGHFGPYQAKLFCAILLPIMFTAIYNAQYVFNAADVNYRCVVPECESPVPAPAWQAGPWAQWALVGGSRCERRAPLVAGGRCEPDNFGDLKQRCTAWVYQNNNTIVSEFNLACQDVKRTMVGAVHSTGVFTALSYIGIVSDSIGRRKTFILAASSCAVAGLARSFATSYYMYLALEYLDPVLGAGTYTTGFVLAIEMVGAKRRVLCGGIIAASFAFGQMVLALVAWLVPYWRTLKRVLYIPSLFFTFYFFFFEESFRWLYTKRKVNEAIRILNKVAAANNKALSEASVKRLIEGMANDSNTQPGDQQKSYLCQLIRSRVLMTRMLICSFCWVTSAFVYYGLSVNSVSLAGSMYVNFALMALAEVPGYALSMLTLDRLGRKIPMMVAYFMCGVCLIALPFIPTEKDADQHLKMSAGGVAQVALAMMGKLCMSAAFNAIYVFTSELFPTPVRHRALAACSLVARLGQIVAMLTPLLMALMSWLPFVLFGGMSLAAALLVLQLPETLHAPLPDSVRQAEAIGRHPPHPRPALPAPAAPHPAPAAPPVSTSHTRARS